MTYPADVQRRLYALTALMKGADVYWLEAQLYPSPARIVAAVQATLQASAADAHD
ncbi:hypothetical protein [Mycobacterium sp. ACS1612]|uniref:hypothetical protein n=1 Tax=Mycobacterium sp. ACS1612 TaxID=1834117 RepID=UPI000ABD7AAF|nr:hypothetical protein [Mycobacterium sp. ACS1612]